ncbi:hypothetical protein H5410_044852 [Solanum commersonii]|uniref:Uncharacterized protein n=1 Tax=Solanum commersonii TaxID=4109 RepID=A0A9J5X9B4_SOLCO|nr:hypothetical protein H5410_044852 [Solanum commersonii]
MEGESSSVKSKIRENSCLLGGADAWPRRMIRRTKFPTSGDSQPSLLHRKRIDQSGQMFIQKRKIKWTKPEYYRSPTMPNRDGNAGKMRRDGGLSQIAFGGQFGRKGIKDALKENRTIFRR